MTFELDPYWYGPDCVLEADVRKTMWLPNGDLISHDYRRILLKWAPGEFQYFAHQQHYGQEDPRARDIAQQIYWHKVREEFEEKTRWCEFVTKWKENIREKVKNIKAERLANDNESLEVQVPVEVPEVCPEQVPDKTISIDDDKECAEAPSKAADEQQDAEGGDVEEKDDDGDNKKDDDDEMEKKEDDKDDSMLESDNSDMDKPQESSTTETTPEQLPKPSKVKLLALKSDNELGSSKSDEGTEKEKGTKARKVIGKGKRLKNNEKREAKKAAKKAISSALLDQSSMFKLSKLGKA